MKVLSFLFAMLFLAEAISPCDDAESCKDEHATQLLGDESHDHNDDAADTCSPFCICSCCGTKMTEPQKFYFPQPEQDFHTLNTPSRELSAIKYYANIWQPPRPLSA